MSGNAEVAPRRAVDRLISPITGAVFAATAAVALQVVWWGWDSPLMMRESIWGRLHSIVVIAGHNSPAVRWLLAAGAVLVVLALAGIAARRAWGFLLALPCSALLIGLAVFARYFAVFNEPRQFVARSAWVRAATLIAVVTLIGHGAAMLLATRRLYVTPVRLAAMRAMLAALAVLIAIVPALWIYGGMRGGGYLVMLAAACGSAVLAALIASAWPHRRSALASIGVSVASLGALAVSIAQLAGDRGPRGKLYSLAAEDAIFAAAVAAPLIAAALGVALVIRSQLTAREVAVPSARAIEP